MANGRWPLAVVVADFFVPRALISSGSSVGAIATRAGSNHRSLVATSHRTRPGQCRRARPSLSVAVASGAGDARSLSPSPAVQFAQQFRRAVFCDQTFARRRSGRAPP